MHRARYLHANSQGHTMYCTTIFVFITSVHDKLPTEKINIIKYATSIFCDELFYKEVVTRVVIASQLFQEAMHG
jgi:hypothetical protein